MRGSQLMTRWIRKTTHTIGSGSTITLRLNPQLGVKLGAVSGELRPNIENATTLFKKNTVQTTGCATLISNQIITSSRYERFPALLNVLLDLVRQCLFGKAQLIGLLQVHPEFSGGV